MIYDKFPDVKAATGFAKLASEDGRTCVVSPERDDSIDPFPFELYGPVVYVDYSDEDREPDAEGFVFEDYLREAAIHFGGRYAGT